jgi:WD40 repeat protein
MSKSSKYILAAGCSFTDPDFTSRPHPDMDTSFPKWPEILGEYLDLDVVNIARSGCGNDYISRKVITHILKNYEKIELVVIGWSEIQRFHIYNELSFNPNVYFLDHTRKLPFHSEHAKPLYAYLYKKYLIDHYYNPGHENIFIWQVKDWFDQMFQVQEICKKFNIKFIMSSLCGSVEMNKYMNTLDVVGGTFTFNSIQWALMFGNIEGLYDLDNRHYWGYPFIQAMNGKGMDQSIPKSHRISDSDMHPNELGHELIARNYYEQYAKVYS